MGQGQRLRSLGGIERMAGLTAGGEADRHQWTLTSLQHSQHLLITILPATSIAPAEPHRPTGLLIEIPQTPAQPMLGLLPHRISAAAQHGRGSRQA